MTRTIRYKATTARRQQGDYIQIICKKNVEFSKSRRKQGKQQQSSGWRPVRDRHATSTPRRKRMRGIKVRDLRSTITYIIYRTLPASIPNYTGPEPMRSQTYRWRLGRGTAGGGHSRIACVTRPTAQDNYSTIGRR